jgi:hypothetical protein
MNNLFETAKEILESKEYLEYLNEDESKVFEFITTSKTKFELLGAEPKKLLKAKQISELFENEEQVFVVTFRIRAMIVGRDLLKLNTDDNDALTAKFVTIEDEEITRPEILIDDMYYSLEYDAELYPNLQSLIIPEEPEPVQEEEQEVVVEETPIEAPQGLKYLLSIVKQNSDHLKFKKIKKLISEATPSKSKWANDDRIGQEQLYEALEKLLHDLKNYTEHSLPFLRPVQKKDAPNYSLVINHPMDLSTMQKNLKAFVYVDNAGFRKDLDLIWENCLTYNTISESIYRKHAFAMRKRANELMAKIPDINIHLAADDMSEEENVMLKDDAGVKDMEIEDIFPAKQNRAIESPPESLGLKDEIMEVEEGGNMDEDESMDQDSPKIQQQMLDDPTYDSFRLLRKWKQATTTSRALKLVFIINIACPSRGFKVGIWGTNGNCPNRRSNGFVYQSRRDFKGQNSSTSIDPQWKRSAIKPPR